MDKKKVLETLFDVKVIKVLKLFVNNPKKEFYLREISKLTKVPVASVFRIIKMMKELELIYEEKIKHLKTYFLNQKNASFLIDLLEDKKSALQEFTDFAKTISQVELVILHGNEEKDKANILIVGSNIDQEPIRLKVLEIKERYGFNIIYLTLAAEQYEQLLAMDLYPGKKVTLYNGSLISKGIQDQQTEQISNG